jgi:hypothetical protein
MQFSGECVVQPSARFEAQCWWIGLVVGVSLFILTGQPFKSAIIAVFVLGSTFLGLGTRWWMRAGLLAAVVAIPVYLGWVPRPDQWADSLHDGLAFLENRFGVAYR